MKSSLLACTFLLGACAWADDSDANDLDDQRRAVCTIVPTQGNRASGVVEFTEVDGGLRVRGRISGLTPNQKHGFHVHEHAFAGSADANCTGGHYDPARTGHHALPGSPGDHHAGDLGNLVADAAGVAEYDAVVADLTVGGRHAIVGRALIVHAKPDDGGQPTGNAGGRIGVGTIGIAGPAHAGH